MLLSIAAVLNWEPTVFDNLHLPSGCDRQAAIDTIVFDNAELSLVYSEPATLKRMIGAWSTSRMYGWQRLWDSTLLEYNPIENYDRFEDYTTEEKRGGSERGKTRAEGDGTSNGTNIAKVRGFDAGTLVDKEQSIDDGQYTSNASGTSETEKKESASVTHTAHMHGNIGVTTSQQMLMSEREVAEFSFYSKISEEFKKKFCIMIY